MNTGGKMDDHIHAFQRRLPVSLWSKVANDKRAQPCKCCEGFLAECAHDIIQTWGCEQIPNHSATYKAGWTGDEDSHASGFYVPLVASRPRESSGITGQSAASRTVPNPSLHEIGIAEHNAQYLVRHVVGLIVGRHL